MTNDDLTQSCTSCRRSKAPLECGICQEAFCKECAQYVAASTFSFLKDIPEDLRHTYYCFPCYDAQVAPPLQAYNEVMDRARNAYFFFNMQRKPIPLIRSSKETVRVENCTDRDETIMRIAFIAMEKGYNAVIDAHVFSKKVRDEGFEKLCWQGTGTPADVNITKLERPPTRFQ